MTTPKISNRKREVVERLKRELLKYPIIGLVKIDNIGARVVQKMRSELRKDAKIVMAKNTLMKIAVNEVKDKIQGIEKINEYIEGPCAFLLTHTNPFKLATYMDKNKVPAPAKAGQVAPNDVVIPPMNTGIPPGPVISELQSLGLKTRIEGGQIRIAEEAVVTKTGERVNRTVALLLRRLGIDPFQAGLRMVVAFENGEIIPGESLVLDYDEYIEKLQQAYGKAINLSVNAVIPTATSISLIITKAFQQSVNLAVNATIINSRSIPYIISRAMQQCLAISSKVASKKPEAISERIKQQLSLATNIAQNQVSSPETTTKEKTEEVMEEEEQEEDLGLGSLFG
ncbi:MAG: 50S ribosomal protein L10 [Candidatus Heimdallarchaeaceae archaeon]